VTLEGEISAQGWRDITTTSLLLVPLPSDNHCPLRDQAKLKILLARKFVICTAGPPTSGCRQIFDTPFRVTT